jgi:hypothetical protein
MEVLQRWIFIFGPPEEIFSDQGSHFVSELFQLYTKTMNATAKFSPTYTAHPNLVERVNQTLIRSLKNYVNKTHDNWDVHVEAATAGYNQRYQDSIGFSPHEAVFGYRPRVPQFTEVDKPEYKNAINHFTNLETIRSTVKSNMEKSIEKSTTNANKKRKSPIRYFPGELVLVRKVKIPKFGETTKFLPNYTLPFRIVNRLSDISYVIRPFNDDDAPTRIVHVSKIKRYFPRRTTNVNLVSSNGKHLNFVMPRKIVRVFTIGEITNCMLYIISFFEKHIPNVYHGHSVLLPYCLAERFMRICNKPFCEDYGCHSGTGNPDHY